MPDPGLTICGLTASAGSFKLGPIDLDVPADRVLVVLGPSGAGKSILLAAIAGLRPSQSGQMHLAGIDLANRPPEKRRIGVVFQDGALFPHLTVRENIRFGPKAAAMPDLAAADALLAQLGIAHLAERAPRSLSGGERQRVALARALAIQPRLLLLDEPLSALDQPSREDMRSLLRELLSQQAIPTIHVTHDRDEALTLADDLAIIADGTIRQAGDAQHVASSPADPASARLLGWTELGQGTRHGNQVHLGDLTLPLPASPAGTSQVRVYYRPQDLVLQAPGTNDMAAGSIPAIVRHVDLTVPLARITLTSTPAITALCLHRDIERLGLRPGTEVRVSIPTGGYISFAK